MKIRFAAKEDSSFLLKIYSQYIETPITFEYTLPSEEEFANRIKEITKEYPYIICEDGDKIVGYAYAHRQMERTAYQWNAELSVYIDKNFTSKGIGKKMYTILLEILKLQGVKNVYGGVTEPNEKSRNLHVSLGFRQLGTYRNTGYKCGRWLDVTWFEKQISDYDKNPSQFIPVTKIQPEKIQKIFYQFNQ